MMHLRRALPIAWAVITLFIISSTAFGQGKSSAAKVRHYGLGHPKSIQDLPYGQLRRNLEKLPPKAQGKALGWLQAFEFPSEDVVQLHVNKFGDVSYADTILPAGEIQTEAATDQNVTALIDPEHVFKLHSKPGAGNVLYLDFDGHLVEGTSWSSSTLTALPFDPSNNDDPPTQANFTNDEINRIFEIWHRISEDYAAFNVDVTTEEPAAYNSRTGHLLFTHDVDANGNAMPSQGAGGVAYVNVFGTSSYAQKYNIAFVYYTNLSINNFGVASYNAEAGSHEFGHHLGLSHDGQFGGSSYYQGHGEGLVSWAPIMGNSYSNNVTQWSNGTYPSANNTQNDVSIIAGDLGYIGDDHGDAPTTATPIVVESNGDILVSSPENDPDNYLSQNKGIIDDRNDVDWFYVDLATAGNLYLTATPAWHSFTRPEKRGANLDIEISVLDENLNLLAIGDPGDDTAGQVSTYLDSGRYFIQIDGVGNHELSDFTDYASLGMYFIEGYVEPGGEQPQADSTPPAPSVMSWQSKPAAIDESSITMTAVTAQDESGPVQYYFTCVSGGPGCVSSGWQTSPIYTLEGLSSDTYYSFNVKAKDSFANENGQSPNAGATTLATPSPIENKAPTAIATLSPTVPVIDKGNSVDVLMQGSNSTDSDGEVVSWRWVDSEGNTQSNTPDLTLRLREGDYQFILEIMDDDGAKDSATLSFSVTKAVSENGGGGKGKSPKK